MGQAVARIRDATRRPADDDLGPPAHGRNSHGPWSLRASRRGHRARRSSAFQRVGAGADVDVRDPQLHSADRRQCERGDDGRGPRRSACQEDRPHVRRIDRGLHADRSGPAVSLRTLARAPGCGPGPHLGYRVRDACGRGSDFSPSRFPAPACVMACGSGCGASGRAPRPCGSMASAKRGGWGLRTGSCSF